MEIFGAGDPKPLISGISEALITSEKGLILAIPALIAHALLSRRVAGILAQMEKLSIAFVNGLSRGMKQKLAIACGLLHAPEVAFFDEPLTGLDPHGIRRMKDVIRERDSLTADMGGNASCADCGSAIASRLMS